MPYTFYELFMLLFVYSFIAWMAETGIASVHKKSFQNRGFVSTPFCFIYGVSAIILTVFFQELRNYVFFLFLGSMVTATGIEWIVGKVLERMSLAKWWNYSNKKFNMDGYVCLQYSIIWGIAGSIVVKYTNDVFVGLFRVLPNGIKAVVVWFLVIIGGIDLLGNLLIVKHMEEKIPMLFRWNRRLSAWTARLSSALASRINRRIKRAYPNTVLDKERLDAEEQKACGAALLLWLLVLGSFLGDMVETIFCRIKFGIWMSRSSLVWGHFSLVWGLAITVATILLYKDRNKPDRYLFLWGTFMGGAYEYICSVFTELMFGKVFWDYSAIPFNLGGRINLLYCFFWGIAAVVWIKMLYPKMEAFIQWLIKKTGRWFSAAMAVFMTVNILVSVGALVRYEERGKGIAAESEWEEKLDLYYDDAKMKKIYPNAIQK